VLKIAPVNDSMPVFWTAQFAATDPSLTEIQVASPWGSSLVLATVTPTIIMVPGRATFGGLWPTDGNARTIDQWESEWISIAHLARAMGRSVLRVRLPPTYFRPSLFAEQSGALERLASAGVQDTNQHVSVGRTPFVGWSKGNRKRARRFSQAGGQVRAAEAGEWAAVHTLLAGNRARRGVTLSMELEKFLHLLHTYPDTYRASVAIHAEEPVAASLTVEIDDLTSYVLYWGDTPTGRSMSAVASLCSWLTDRARHEGKAFLDLGTSSSNGCVDAGLYRFKANLGADASSRSTWDVVLSRLASQKSESLARLPS